jgi:hypothetical protein
MTSQRWSTLVSGLVLTLALSAGSPARAQFGFQGIPGSPSVSGFGLGYESGTSYGISPFSYGSFGGAGFSGFGGIGTFPALPGYRLSSGQRPQAITSYQSVSSAVTLVPGWNGSAHRVRRRH